ncbi:AMP-binding protein [Pseudomonas mosselii]|uniref:AMP-binding protein n=1 Tax=Pseudomonas mosselii TaxID=78327 RepID=UPI0015E8B9F5|nr:AMP-binding protein [Pseudomonas mosselii]
MKNLKVARCNATEVAGELVAAGLMLWSEQGRLCYAGPPGALTDRLKALASEVRDALVERLMVERLILVPPSRAQQRIYAAHMIAGEGGSYSVPMAWQLHGPVDIDRLRDCMIVMVQRHEVLRQGFERFAGELVGVISAQAELDLVALSVLDEPGQAPSAVARKWLEDEAGRPFDVSRRGLFRVRVVSARDGSVYLLWVLHHLVCDEWSTAQLVEEFASLYSDGTAVLPAPSAYRDYVSWERQQTGSDGRSRLLEKCVKRLERGSAEPSRLLRYEAGNGDWTALEQCELTPEVSAAVSDAARSLKVSEFTFLLAAFVMLQARYSPTRDASLVTPVTARLDEQLMRVVGPVQQLALIGDRIEPDRVFSDLCRCIAQQVEEAMSPDYPSMDRVLVEYASRNSGARAELLGTLFVMTGPAMNLRMGALRGVSLGLRNREAKANLLACASRSDGVLHLAFEYRPHVLDKLICEQMLADYARLLEQCALDVSTCEQRMALACAQSPQGDRLTQIAPKGSVPQWIADIARRRPDAVAITGIEHVTYGQLDRFAAYIGQCVATMAFQGEACIAVWGRLDARMIGALLGVMRAGACVVPFDADLPWHRVEMICQRDNIQLLVVCDPSLVAPHAPHGMGIPVMVLDQPLAAMQLCLQNEVMALVHADSLAYVMYTSGSTGEPKGVSVSHGAFASFVDWATRALDISHIAAFNVLTHASFDVSLFEVFAPLVAGCPLFINDGHTYHDRLRGLSIGGFAAVPSVLRSALATGISLEPVTHLFVAGEVFSPALAALLASEVPKCSVWNLYGPTEAVVYTSIHKVAGQEQVPIGVARDGLRCHVVRDDWSLLPDGAVGELAIGGLIARGYRNMPALTAARFVPDPFSDQSGARMYLTGDSVFVDGKGVLNYVGRRDRQLKSLGVRLEPEEIERALLDHPQVRAAFVCSSEGDALLVAFVEARLGELQEHDLRRFCLERLPRAMIPKRFVISDLLERTPAGKLDASALRARLQALEQRPSTAGQPTNQTQSLLVQLWADLLGHTGFDIRTNFFEAGGNSLLLLALHDRLPGKESGADTLSVIELFTYTTVEQMAARLDHSVRSTIDETSSLNAKNYRAALRRHKVKYGNDESI